MPARVVTVMQGQQYLHEVTPNGIFGYRFVVFLSVFDDIWKVAATTVFHEYIENTSITVYVAVMISDNVVMVEVFQDVTDANPSKLVNDSSWIWGVLTLPLQFVSCLVRSYAQSWVLCVPISVKVTLVRTRQTVNRRLNEY
jgi:hypothetical protein